MSARETLAADGFIRFEADQTKALLGDEAIAEWKAFADSWNDLGLDTFMADGGRYRRRRFAAFSARPGAVARKPHQPHWQSRDYNPLNGGVQRWFEPVTDAIADHPVTQGLIAAGLSLFGSPAAPSGGKKGSPPTSSASRPRPARRACPRLRARTVTGSTG